ncbi:MAG TPA: TIGR04063 family PEP-CTERM/XrtA system glycosyltransferase, partial [Casimicrobiaceae bacterium]|nr:TIGR04063 family PEP-CTERM/XrtA system glycosyltransferase [Casimicrobiaceae bacterium]
MRILHILDHSLPLHSGYTFRTLSILREQRRVGWETSHLTGPKQGSGDRVEETVDDWHFFRTPPSSALLGGLPAAAELAMMNVLAHRLEAVARQVRPHLLHAHSPVLNAIPALRVGRRLGLPVLYEVRAFWEDAAVDHGRTREGAPRYRLSRALETYALKRADAVTTICEGLRSDIIARGIDPQKVTVVPNAVDVEKFVIGREPDVTLRRQLQLEDAIVLGFIGSFYAYEGLTVLLEALPKILAVEPRARLLLVGGGPQEGYLKQRAAAMSLEDKVRFAGRVPHSEVERYYDLIDVLVYPRLSMRLTELVTPLKPLEAMAQGRLLAASDVGGHRELIRDRETGVLFRAGDVDALAGTVLELLAD